MIGVYIALIIGTIFVGFTELFLIVSALHNPYSEATSRSIVIFLTSSALMGIFAFVVGLISLLFFC